MSTGPPLPAEPRPAGGALLLGFAALVAAAALLLPAPRAAPVLHALAAPAAAPALEALLRAHFGADERCVVEVLRGAWEDRLRRRPRPDLLAAPGPVLRRLARAGWVEPPTAELVRPRLVVLVGRHAPALVRGPEDLLRPGVRPIAVLDPHTAAGRLARGVLKELGLWYLLLPRLHPYPTPAAVVGALRTGRAQAAVLLTTPPRPEAPERIAYVFPPILLPPPPLAAGAVRGAERRKAARAFVRFLAGPKARRVRAALCQGREPAPAPPSLRRRLAPLLLSLRVASVAVMLLFPLVLLLGGLVGTATTPVGRALRVLCLLPLVFPPPALGLLLLAVLGPGGPWARATGFAVHLTWQGAALTAAAAAVPFALLPFLPALRRTAPAARAVAHTAALGRAAAYWLVHLPLAARGLLAGLLLAFARALGEFGATLLVAGNVPGWTTGLSGALYRASLAGERGTAWALWAAGVFVVAATGGTALWIWDRDAKV